MKQNPLQRHIRIVVICALLSACAGQMAHREGVSLLAQGKNEEALAKLNQAVKEAPDNGEFRLRYLTAKENLINQLLSKAQDSTTAAQSNEAESSYRRVLAIDPKNTQATDGLAQLERNKQHQALLTETRKLLDANNLEAAKARITAILQDNPSNGEARALQRDLDERTGQGRAVMPILNQNMQRPISIEVRDANLKQVIEMLARHSGVNFILDKDVPPNLMITTWLRQVTVEDALDVILSTNNLQKRVLNDNTLLVYPNTQAKQNEHQDLVVKGIYLANADAKQTLAMLKGVLKTKNAYVDEKLNLIVMRDTPEAIRLAERMVAMMDVGEPEVMLEVEVLEVKRSRLSALGIQFPNQLTLAPLPSSGTAVTLADLKSLGSNRVSAALGNTTVNAKLEVGDTNLLANPRIRARSKEKATIKIGDRVPITTTTANATGFVAENIQYIDVGLKLEVEPTVYLDDEVAIKINLEVSSVVKEIRSASGNLSYQIGGRNASTVIRLKDGETQVLGGLINDEDRKTGSRIPGLGDLPIIGRIFGSQSDDDQKTELILSITPRLIRGVKPPRYAPTEFWSGTENDMRVKPITSVGNQSMNALRLSPALSSGSAPIQINGSTSPAPQAVSPATTLTLQWEGSNQARVGQPFDLLLKANIDGKVSSLPLQIKYDPAVFALQAITPGDLSAPATGTEFTHKLIENTGTVLISQNRKTENPFSGSGATFKLSLRPLKASERSMITLMPTTPIAPDNRPLPQTASSVIGVSVAP